MLQNLSFTLPFSEKDTVFNVVSINTIFLYPISAFSFHQYISLRFMLSSLMSLQFRLHHAYTKSDEIQIPRKPITKALNLAL